MRYSEAMTGRFGADASDAGRMNDILSFADVEERLVEAMRLCWQDEGGVWPFASDGPWNLIRKEWWDWDARDAKALPRMPMSRVQMARRDEAVGWLALVREADRRLVVLAVRELAKGKAQVPWRDLLAPMGKSRGADGLRMRYGRAMTALVRRINATSPL